MNKMFTTFFQRNPVVLEGLVQLMLGAPNHIYHGGLLHTSVRYFDPSQRRSGIPADVAALVERITSQSITLKLVNLHPTEHRKVIIQGGMFGEHQIKRVRQVVDYPYQFYTIDKKYFQVELGPGAVGQLELDIDRFVNPPFLSISLALTPKHRLMHIRLKIFVGILIMSWGIPQLDAQLLKLSQEQLIALTPKWEGKRFPDGRPKVPLDLVERMKSVSLEEAWAVLRNNGYMNQYAGEEWKIIHPQQAMTGRALTAQYMPKRLAIREVLEEEGDKRG